MSAVTSLYLWVHTDPLFNGASNGFDTWPLADIELLSFVCEGVLLMSST